jgi:hypothetical protein
LREKQMRRLTVGLLAAVLFLAAGGSVFAKGWDSWFDRNDMDFTGTVGISFPFGIALNPGFEYVFATWRIGDAVPFAFGGGVRAMLDFDRVYGVEFGIGPLVTAHLGLKGLDIPDFLQRFDFYWGLGIAFVFPVWWTGWPVGFLTVGGLNWFIKDNLALVLEGDYFGWYGGIAIGVLFKF